jgi:outer membrane protein OmpA-like peptidoglycan-associated protein
VKTFISTILFAAVAMTGVAAAQQSPDEISKSTQAVGYTVGGGSTKIDIVGTDLLPGATCEAEVEAKQGATTIQVDCKNLVSPQKFGAEFLTYVLWAVSPEGRTVNLGELAVKENGEAKRKSSTPLQMFSLIITTEPYYAVRMPSELVVAENEVRKRTKGKIFPVNSFSLMKKAQYQKKANPLALTMDLKNVPLEMYEARNAFEIAKLSQAEKYSPEIYKKAEASLKMAENSLAKKANSREIISTAMQATQFSEDARALAVQRAAEERLANERKASAEAQRLARERADQEAKQRAEAETARQNAEAARQKAEVARAQALLQEQQAKQKAVESARQQAEAEAAKARAEVEKLKAESERQAAQQKEEAARKAADDADRARKQAEDEKSQLRAKLLQQFSQVLDTRDTDRGLVVNMSDVLFDTGKYTLRQEAREKLARIAGIVLNYPGLKLEAEGHTDNTGSAEFNQKLSEQRADSVRQYLVTQGIPESSITSSGKGFSISVAPNDTAAGRQKNRRVELIVSGEVIGTAIGK